MVLQWRITRRRRWWPIRTQRCRRNHRVRHIIVSYLLLVKSRRGSSKVALALIIVSDLYRVAVEVNAALLLLIVHVFADSLSNLLCQHGLRPIRAAVFTVHGVVEYIFANVNVLHAGDGAGVVEGLQGVFDEFENSIARVEKKMLMLLLLILHDVYKEAKKKSESESGWKENKLYKSKVVMCETRSRKQHFFVFPQESSIVK